MSKKEYIQLLSNQDKLRIKFEARNKKVALFIVQYYALIEGRWRTVMRADNCHGIPHIHRYHLQSKEFKVFLDQDNKVAFNEAKSNILKNFSKIRENFINS